MTKRTPSDPRGTFFQDGPELGNQYRDDPLLSSLLDRLLPEDVRAEAEPALDRMGELAAGPLVELGDRAEASPPVHVPFDPWGRRVDRVEVSDAWRRLGELAAEEGLVALAYERPWGARSRIVQHALLYLFGPPSATYLCPLAMTDGGARLLEVVGPPALRERIMPRLVSRDPHRFWTSGQWMTERTGGSDVGRSETRAIRDEDGTWRLWGTKWFTSAVDSQVAFTLARPEGSPPGSRGLALFCLELRDEKGRLRGIEVDRLKDKLGTKALPTAELTLRGTPCHLVAGPGEGVKTITLLMNVTRIYNATAAVAGMRRAWALAVDYADRREAFGRRLADLPLHEETLAEIETEIAGALVTVFRAVELQGREEAGVASDEERRTLRLLTPLVKLMTGKQAVRVASEALECFGGAGYLEDTGVPRLLRDAQVLPIWEGTTNVLSLDTLRAVEREAALEPLLAETGRRIELGTESGLGAAREAARESLHAVRELAGQLQDADRSARERRARHFALALARTVASGLLLEQASASVDAGAPEAERWRRLAHRWCTDPRLSRRAVTGRLPSPARS